MNLTDLPAAPGTYALILRADAPTALTVQRLGSVTLTAGLYAYVGSAHGPGGLRARVGRHLRPGKPRHWHVDHLTAALPVVHIVTIATGARLECAWVRFLIELNGASVPVPGFGNSDCRAHCPAHLVRLPDGLKLTELEEILVVEQRSEANPRATTDTFQALLDAISAGDDETAERTAQACSGLTALLPAVRPLLADPDPDRRWWAVRLLASLGGDEAGALLVARLNDSDEATRCAAALGLGQLRATDAVPALTVHLADPSGWVRDSAGDALAMIGAPALPALVEALSDGRDGVRVRAAGALRKVISGALAGRRSAEFEPEFWPAIGALFTALNDPNRLVRHNAYEALDRLGLLETLLIPA